MYSVLEVFFYLRHFKLDFFYITLHYILHPVCVPACLSGRRWWRLWWTRSRGTPASRSTHC